MPLYPRISIFMNPLSTFKKKVFTLMSYSNIEHSVNNEEYILFLHIDLDVYLYICSTASEEG